MNEDQKANETMRYFQRYRDMCQRLSDADAEYAERCKLMEMERDMFFRRKQELQNEVLTMRRIITRMIEEDMDPTMAKLQQDESWNDMSTLWHKFDPFESYDTTVDLSAISITGAVGSTSSVGSITTGAIGASGPSWNYGPSYGSQSPGANGPGGPMTTT